MNPVWTKKRPTVPGWYWVRVKKTGVPEYLTIVNWDYLQSWFRCPDRHEMRAWAGPVAMPEEAPQG